MQDLITVRLEVAGVKHQILHAFSAHTKDMQHAAEQAVTAALDSFDFSRELFQAAQDELGSATREVIRRAMHDPEIHAAFMTALNKALRAYVRKERNMYLNDPIR